MNGAKDPYGCPSLIGVGTEGYYTTTTIGLLLTMTARVFTENRNCNLSPPAAGIDSFHVKPRSSWSSSPFGHSRVKEYMKHYVLPLRSVSIRAINSEKL